MSEKALKDLRLFEMLHFIFLINNTITDDKHDQRVGFLVHKDIVKSVISPNFKQTHDSAAESKPFQHYHHSGICTNI